MKKVYRVLFTLLTVAFLIIFAPLLAPEAKAASVDDLTFTITGGSCTVSGCNKSASGELTIPDTYRGFPVYGIDSYALENCNGLTSILISDNVSSIGDGAFEGCTSLTSIILGSRVTRIGGSAFRLCTSLTSITIGNKVKYIGGFAFSRCTSLISITIPDSVTSIGDYAFGGCTNLTSITIPNGVTSLSDAVFDGCTSLTAIVLPKDIDTIWDNAFRGCNSLAKVYYRGTKAEWNWITIRTGNDVLINATIIHDFVCTSISTECTTHHYGDWTNIDSTTHKRICSVCQKEETATHTHSNACDTDCNTCGYIRTVTHSHQTTWSKDSTSHWHECSTCKDKKDLAAHTPGAEATETTAQTCTTCGFVIIPALGHTHSFAASWTTNGGSHWHECSVCKDKKDLSADTPGAAATETTPQTCTVCGYVIKAALGVPETRPTEPAPTEPAPTEPTPTEPMPTEPVPTETVEPTDAPTAPSKPTVAPTAPDGSGEDEDDSAGWIDAVVIVAAVLVAAGGGTVAVIILKKKK